MVSGHASNSDDVGRAARSDGQMADCQDNPPCDLPPGDLRYDRWSGSADRRDCARGGWLPAWQFGAEPDLRTSDSAPDLVNDDRVPDQLPGIGRDHRVQPDRNTRQPDFECDRFRHRPVQRAARRARRSAARGGSDLAECIPPRNGRVGRGLLQPGRRNRFRLPSPGHLHHGYS